MRFDSDSFVQICVQIWVVPTLLPIGDPNRTPKPDFFVRKNRTNFYRKNRNLEPFFIFLRAQPSKPNRCFWKFQSLNRTEPPNRDFLTERTEPRIETLLTERTETPNPKLFLWEPNPRTRTVANIMSEFRNPKRISYLKPKHSDIESTSWSSITLLSF